MIDLATVREKPVDPLAQVAWLGGTYAASNVTRAAFGVATSIVIARGPGPDTFGLWALWTAWAGMLTMAFDGGFGVLVTRDTARDPTQAGRLAGAAIVIRLAAFAPLAFALWAAAPRFTGSESGAAVPVIVLLAAAGLVYGGLASAFKAWPAYVPAILAVETAGAALNCAGAVGVAWYGPGARMLLLVALLIQVLQIAAVLALWQRKVGLRTLTVPGFRDALVLTQRAWPFALSGLIANGQARLGPLMLGALSTTGQVAMFGVASRFVEGVKMLPQAALAGVLPVLAAEQVGWRADDVRSTFHRRLRVFAAVAALTLAALAYPLVWVTFGARYLEAWPTLAVLAIGLMPTLTNSGRRVYLYAQGREQDATRWSGRSLIIQGLVAAALVPGWGATGAAVALAVGESAVARPLGRASRR